MASSKSRLPDNTAQLTDTWYAGIKPFQLEYAAAPAAGTSQITIPVDLPDDCEVKAVRIRVDTPIAMTSASATKVCIGFSSNIDNICEVAVTSLDAAGDEVHYFASNPTDDALAGSGGDAILIRGTNGVSDRTVVITPAAGGATAASSFSAGVFTVSIEGFHVVPIAKLSN